MALLRRSRKFMLNFAKISLIRQVQRFIFTPKQGVVMRILYNPNIKTKFTKKQICKRFLSHYSINKNNYNDDDAGVPLTTLLNRTTVLENEFKNLKIDYKYLYDTIKMYAELSENVDSSVDIFLLNCCGEVLPDVKYTERQKLTRQAWNLLQEKNRITSLAYYHTLINVYNQNYHHINPDEFVKNMKIEPNEITYLHLLQAAAKTGDFTKIDCILSKLQEFNYLKNLEQLTEDHLRKNNLDSVLLKNINLLNFQSPNEIHGYLACGYALRGDISNVIKILENYSLNHKQLLTVLKNVCLFEDGKFIDNILSYIPAKEIVTNPMLTNTIIELVHLNKINEASKIVDFIVANNERENSRNIVKHYLQALVRADIPLSIILNIGNKMVKRNSYPNNNKELLLLLLEENLRCGKEYQSLSLMESMVKQNIEIRPHYYWPLLIKAAKTKGESGVLHIMDHMSKMDVHSDFTTLFEYILPYINTLNLPNTFKKLTKYESKTTLLINSIACYSLDKGNIYDVYKFMISTNLRISFDQILPLLVKNFKIHKDADVYARLLKFALRNKDYPGLFLLAIINCYVDNSDITNLISSFSRHKVFITLNTVESMTTNKTRWKTNQKIIQMLENYNIVKNKINMIKIEQCSPEFIEQVKNDEDALKCLWFKLKLKGICSYDVLYRLFMIACDNNDIKQVELIKKEFKKHGLELTSEMKSVLIKLLARNGKVNEMYSLLVDLQVNNSTFKKISILILIAAIVLFSDDKVELAWNLINNSNTSKVYHQSQCYKLLNLIAESKYSTLTNLILTSLVTKNYCKIDEFVLEPLIIQHLVKNDLSAATKSFKYCNSYYNKTPLHRELVYMLIKSINNNPSKSNKILLQDVLGQINYYHGQLQVEMDLVIAYARCNMLEELRMSLMNLPEQNFLFFKFLKGLSQKDSSILLRRILEVSIEIDQFDNQEICKLLLSMYSNLSDWKSAVELWKKMRNSGIEPTVGFEKKFLTFLSKHKIQLPCTLIKRKEYLG